MELKNQEALINSKYRLVNVFLMKVQCFRLLGNLKRNASVARGWKLFMDTTLIFRDSAIKTRLAHVDENLMNELCCVRNYPMSVAEE